MKHRALVDLGTWITDFERAARRAGDQERLRLVELSDRSWEIIQQEPERALAYCEEGAALARKLGEPCWELYHDYWRCEIYWNYLRHSDTGRDVIVKTFVKAQGLAYRDCLIVGRVFRMMTDMLFRIDSDGYIDDVRAMDDYTQQQVPLDDDALLLIMRRRAAIAYIEEDYDVAERETRLYLAECSGNAFRQTDAYILLSKIAAKRDDVDGAYQYAIETERAAHRANRISAEGIALLRQARYQQMRGFPDEARALYERGEALMTELPHFYYSDYYDAVCGYLELVGEIEEAISLRDRQLEELIQDGVLALEIDCRIERCRLFGRLKLPPLEEELNIAYEQARKLPRPDRTLQKLDRIKNGDYSDK